MGYDEITLGEWAKEWLYTYKKQEVAITTFKNYEGYVNKYILNNDIGSIKINDIKPIHIQKCINSLNIRGVKRGAKFLYITFDQIFDKALYNDLIIKNVVKGIKSPSYSAKPKTALSKVEQHKMLNADYTDIVQKAFVYLGLYTGMRKGEILSLTKNDIDFSAKTIQVNKNLVFNNNKGFIKDSPKTKTGNRKIPMTFELETFLKQYINNIDNYLFGYDGKTMTKSQNRRLWKNILDCVKLDRHITIHYLRHTYATNLYFAKIDVKTAQYLLGHSTVRMTIDLYTHLENENTIHDAGIQLSEYMASI